jgi:glycosyltransferase involved in cell wall biosynthesis
MRPAPDVQGKALSGPAIIVVQQESLRERPRVHKLAAILLSLGKPVEIWKFGDAHQNSELDFPVRNLISSKWRAGSPVLRYLVWMVAVYVNRWRHGRKSPFFAVGFDSAFPLSFLPGTSRWLVFDNLDNISLNYRWPRWLAPMVRGFESWVARRAKLHIVPSRARWSGDELNLRIVTNTPSREALEKASALAKQRGYSRQGPFTIYVNGWLSPTRGIQSLLCATDILRKKSVEIRVLVAGRLASRESEELIRLNCAEYAGLLPNAEALALYFRSDLAFTYYDPSIAINRVAESQKWTDCWGTGTPFVANAGIQTLEPYVRSKACFVLPYADGEGLANLVEDLITKPEMLAECRRRLQRMSFQFWDDEMEIIVRHWLSSPKRSAQWV